MYNDPDLEPLKEALEAVLEQQQLPLYDTSTSLQDALSAHNLPEHLRALAVAGYGNTAGCCDLSQLSISQLIRFEHYWETNETEGDFRPTQGMYSIVQWTIDRLQQHDNFELILNCPVDKLLRNEEETAVELFCANDLTYTSHAVVVTVPPPLLPNLIEDLPLSKQRAIPHIGMERAVKVICKFSQQLWPDPLQSVIAADDQPIPEVWFRSFDEEDNNCHLAEGFLVSGAADRFVEAIADIPSSGNATSTTREQRATDLFFHQLSLMLKLPLEELTEAHVDTLVYDWKDHPYIQGGYSE
jgi:monoamine oxidase